MAVAPSISIRTGTAADAPQIVELIRGLADFEKLAGPDAEAAARFAAHVTEPSRLFDVLVAHSPKGIVGYALYFFTYSTFRARPKLYIEDLFVLPAARNGGIGTALLLACARAALLRECCAMEWAVLDWNMNAQRFYRRHGAQAHTEWHPYGVDATTLGRLASAPAPNGLTISALP
jgi:GNAT superfamily N-acetyltransferase